MNSAQGTEVDATIASFAHVPGGLMPALHAIQRRDGFVDPSLVPILSDVFNLTSAEVHGVVTFYSDFRTSPPVGPIVQVCRAEACQAVGGEAVHAAAAALAGRTGAFELIDAYCLGNCALGPSVAVDDVPFGRVDSVSVETVIASVRGHRVEPRVSDGSQPSVTVYVPRDSAARSVGADAVAAELASHAGVQVVRNGSRGMLFLEPLVEVSTPSGRIGYGPVAADDVAELMASGLLDGADHPLRLGPVDELPWMKAQQRLTFARVGVVDPRSPSSFAEHGGLDGLRVALSLPPDDVIAAVTASGLRGRGGAAFPTGIKWRTVADAAGSEKYVVCNADEGDSGTFADRMLMEGDPFTLIEGMLIAGYAVGAGEGYIYVRSEYPDAIEALRCAIEAAIAEGWLGESVLGTEFAFHLHVRVGAGAYICGEETAMLESLEGRRGIVRSKPPLPALEGLFGKPTVVNNVLSLATIPIILSAGAQEYAAFGLGRSRGTQVFQLAGNVARGGIVETAFGVSLGHLVTELGGGTRSGRPVRAVQVGGPLGSYLPVEQFDLPMDYEAFAAADALVGHGGIVVFDDTVDMAAQARFAMAFCAHESCGKCTPCRIGSTRGVELIDKVVAGVDRDDNLRTLLDLCEVMADASLCAMGGLTPLPVRSALTHFVDDFQRTPGGDR